MKNECGKYPLAPKWLLFSLCTASSLLVMPGQSIAQTVGLSDGGSTATVDLSGGGGMNSWTVLGGLNQLQQQWFYYSVNGSAVQAINLLGTPTINSQSANLLNVTYANSQLSVNVQYSLTGGGVGSGNADIGETIAVDNLSGSSIGLKFYQYSHFDLLGSGNNTVQIYGDPVNGFEGVQQSAGATALQEAIALPNATGAEAAFYGQTLNSFASIPGYDLNGNPIAGPGDVTWAFEWSQALGVHGELDITKDKALSISMVPEPSSLGLIAVGLGAFGCRLFRRRS